MNKRYRYEDDEPPTLEMMCRRDNYETIINDRAYCVLKKDEKCMYRADEIDEEIGYARCMNIDKQYM